MKIAIKACIILSFFLIFLSLPLLSQNFDWVNKLNEGKENYIAKSVAVDNNGGIYISGYYQNNPEQTKFFLSKYDSLGFVHWTQISSGNGTNRGNEICISSEYIYVTGGFSGTLTFSDTLVESSGRMDVFLTCFNFDGTFNYIKKYGGIFNEEGSGIYNHNESLYLSIQHDDTLKINDTSFVSDYYEGAPISSYVLLKTNLNGEIRWTKDGGRKVACNDDFVYSIYKGIIPLQYNHNGIINIKENAWDLRHIYNLLPKSIEIINSTDLILDKDGNLYFIGNYQSRTNPPTSFIVKCNDNLESIWAIKISQYMTGVNAITYSENNSITITGNIYGLLGVDTVSERVGDIMYVGQYDTYGNLIWYKNITSSQKNDSQGYDLVCDSHNNIYVTGWIQKTAGFDDIFITDTAQNTGILAKLRTWKKSEVKLINKKPGMDIYPNPSNGVFYIKNQFNFNDFKITDSQGKIVAIIPATRNYVKQQIDIRNLKSGIYFIIGKRKEYKMINKVIKF